MAGIYLHIPFCKQACHYCNFHFSTSLKQKDALLDALLQEIEMQKDYLQGQPIQSIYLGGGTPSLLTQHELERLFSRIYALHQVSETAEITLEANPDDLNRAALQALHQTPINRLSIGIQSFSEADLQFMNRAHNASEAEQCIDLALEAGFTSLTVDLIYGTPTMSDTQWAQNMQKVFDKGIPHISCYCLTVEPHTALDHLVKKGKAKPVEEDQAARQFEMLMKGARVAGYEHYEISNFAKPGHYARHNANYWLGEHYLGLGPSAHSFNGQTRQWNIANNSKYIQAIAKGELPFEEERLSSDQRYNEYIMTGLRTIWGCNLEKINAFGATYQAHFLQQAKPFLADGSLIEINHTYRLSDAGRLLADRIAMELFV
ncbi:MAG: radical SAM family heme chaperone HemW [Saprospiraceae bacterium]